MPYGLDVFWSQAYKVEALPPLLSEEGRFETPKAFRELIGTLLKSYKLIQILDFWPR